MNWAPKLLQIRELVELATAHNPAEACEVCAALASPGWESLPGNFDTAQLLRVGTLRRYADGDVHEPTLDEYHPGGTHLWSADAPIASAFFP